MNKKPSSPRADPKQILGDNIRRIRHEVGISQEELADRANLHRTYISSIERERLGIMGLKTDTSFLKFVSMGAIGVRQTISQLQALGFRPIVLERYCDSNKIWTTKVKRLRLPDLLCIRTGLRVEVRGKSDLQIRMSDAPNNPDRTWDAGLRDDDVAAFIAILQVGTIQRAADEAALFTIRSLRESVAHSKLGAAKSASEGAERDRTWPAIIPSADGVVREITPEKLKVELNKAGGGLSKQTYTLNGKSIYVRAGDRFKGEVSFLAGMPNAMADLPAVLRRQYDPLPDLQAPTAVDRYAAVKALPRREDLRDRAIPALEELLRREQEERVALEAAGSLAALGSGLGQERMLGSQFARTELVRVAADDGFEQNEIRQAAVWGLGKAGLKAYDQILPFIDHQDENLAAHAIVSFGSDTPEHVIRALVQALIDGEPRRAAAASEVLRLIGDQTVLRALIEAAEGGNEWVIATLGRLPAEAVRPAIANTNLSQQVAPLLLLGEGSNWLASEDRVMDIAFLTKQNL